jgi:hypothetical protein
MGKPAPHRSTGVASSSSERRLAPSCPDPKLLASPKAPRGQIRCETFKGPAAAGAHLPRRLADPTAGDEFLVAKTEAHVPAPALTARRIVGSRHIDEETHRAADHSSSRNSRGGSGLPDDVQRLPARGGERGPNPSLSGRFRGVEIEDDLFGRRLVCFEEQFHGQVLDRCRIAPDLVVTARTQRRMLESVERVRDLSGVAAALPNHDALPLDEAFWREARGVVPGQVHGR